MLQYDDDDDNENMMRRRNGLIWKVRQNYADVYKPDADKECDIQLVNS